MRNIIPLCLLACVLSGCDRSAPPLSPEKSAAKTWTDIAVARPEDRITVHYHRTDEKYESAGIWTWDGNQKNTPEQNELAPLGRDHFGLVFQFDRARYGGSIKIGLIPRYDHNWDRKDGDDKFWTPALGQEVWLINGRDEVFAKAPNLSLRVESAYVDGPKSIVVTLSEQARLPVKVTILDQRNVEHGVRSAFPTGATGHPAAIAPGSGSFKLTIVPKEALDVANGRYRIRVHGFGEATPLVPRGILDDREIYYDANARLGATYTPEGTTFRIFAPVASAVNVVLYDEAAGPRGRTPHALKAQSKGLWELTVDGDLQGKFYVYTLDGPGLDRVREVFDPYSANAVASSTRGRVTPPLPAPRAGPTVASPTDIVVYEMHVRDFTVSPTSGVRNRGLYLGFTEAGTRLASDAAIRTGLDHLVELGVTHVELLPVQDFADDEAQPSYNWGYITSGFFSPEGMYATNPNDDSRVRELKALVDALHARGIGVIMDVVYNHTSLTAPFDAIAPGYYYRHLENGALADGAACGNEIRSEAPMVRKLILDSLKHWTVDYGFDGFRFDLMALIDQETMRLAESELHAINPNLVLFGEPWTGGASPLQDKSDKTAVRRLPVGAFNDTFRNALKGSPDGRDAGFIQTGANADAFKSALLISGWFGAPGQSINYMTCHDNLVLWDKLKISMPRADDALLIETMKLGYCALFTSQGVPYFHGGEEFARSKGGNNNSYDSPDAVNQVDWMLKKKHFDLYAYTRDAIALRKAHPVFRLRTSEEVAARLKFGASPNAGTLMYTLDAAGVPQETWKRVCVVLNSDDSNAAEVLLPDGEWHVALDERGAANNRSVTGKTTVRHKSGQVLYQ